MWVFVLPLRPFLVRNVQCYVMGRETGAAFGIWIRTRNKVVAKMNLKKTSHIVAAVAAASLALAAAPAAGLYVTAPQP